MKTFKILALISVLIAGLLLALGPALADDWPNSKNDSGNSSNSLESINLPLTEQWHSSAPSVEENGVVVSNGIAYLSTDDGQLYAFTVATGAVVPGYPVTTSPNFGSPAVDASSGIVYVLSGSTFRAFNLDGTSAWTAAVGSTGNNFNKGPIVEDGFVYIKAGSSVQKFDSSGNLQWSTGSAGNNTQPSIWGGFVYVNTEAGQIRKYDLGTGVEVTTGGFPISTPASQAGISTVNGRIFHKADITYAYDASTGALDWSAASGGDSTFYNSPTVAGGVVYIYGWDSKLYAFDEATGAAMAGFPSAMLGNASDRNWSSPAVAGDKVFVGAGTTQKLKVVGAAGSGTPGVVIEEHLTFSADPQGFDLCSPVISDGVVFALLDGGGLYAFFTSGVVFTGGAIEINGDVECTDSQNVTLTLDAGTNPNVTEMRLSEKRSVHGRALSKLRVNNAVHTFRRIRDQNCLRSVQGLVRKPFQCIQRPD